MKYATLKVYVHTSSIGDKAVQCTFHEDTDEEVTTYVPYSVMEDQAAVHDTDEDNNATISVARWFLRNNDIVYDSDSDQNVADRFAALFEDERDDLWCGKD